MRSRWAWALIALSACVGRSPCSGTRGGQGGGGADKACAAWATHYCDRLQSCAPLSVDSAYGDLARCVARNERACSSALDAPGTSSTLAGVEACAQAYDSERCDVVVVGKAPARCNTPGSLPPGAPCRDNSQCSGANGYCRMSSDQPCGTCAVLGAEGAGCESDRDCQYGLVCYFTCMAPVALGEACDGMIRQCPATLLCFNYVCSPPAGAGAPCDPRADNCDRDHELYCDPQARVCSHFAMAEVGAPCGSGTICKGGSCPANVAEPSRCVANATDRASCDSASGPFCTPPARCVSGACKLPDVSSCR